MSHQSIDDLVDRLTDILGDLTRFEAEMLNKLVEANDYEGVRDYVRVIEQRYNSDIDDRVAHYTEEMQELSDQERLGLL